MALRIREFQNAHDLEFFLRGGIRGGKKIINPSGLVQNLHGKTLIFTAPAAATVTFDETAGAAGLYGGLTYKEIVTQIIDVISGLEASFRDGVLNLVEATPTAGVAVTAAGTANSFFGFSGATANAGSVISPAGGAAPTLQVLVSKANNDGYAAVIDEA